MGNVDTRVSVPFLLTASSSLAVQVGGVFEFVSENIHSYIRHPIQAS